MPSYTHKTAIHRIKNADKHLARIHLPKMVDLSEHNPFNVNTCPCKLCYNQAESRKTVSGWMIECENALCANEIQAPVEDEWKAELLWNELNAQVNDYRLLPFFHLEGLPASRAKAKLKHIDNYIRMNRDKAVALDYLGNDAKGFTQTMYKASYWNALYSWVICAKAAVNRFKPEHLKNR